MRLPWSREPRAGGVGGEAPVPSVILTEDYDELITEDGAPLITE